MNSKKVLLGALAGIAVGVLAGILISPDKGSRTRRNLLNKGEDSLDDLKDKFDDFVDEIAAKYDESRKEVVTWISKGKANHDGAAKKSENNFSEV